MYNIHCTYISIYPCGLNSTISTLAKPQTDEFQLTSFQVLPILNFLEFCVENFHCVEIAWSRREGLLCWDEDQGWRVLSRSNGKFKAGTQTLPICPNLSETHHRSICFHKLITVDPTRCSFTFTSTANEWHQLNRLPNPLDFYKTALRQTLVLKHFPFSRSIARKSHIIDYISVQIYQNIFVLGLHHSWT